MAMNVKYSISASIACPAYLGWPAIDRVEMYVADGDVVKVDSDVIVAAAAGGGGGRLNAALANGYRSAPDQVFPMAKLTVRVEHERALVSRLALAVVAVQPTSATTANYYLWSLLVVNGKLPEDGVVECDEKCRRTV